MPIRLIREEDWPVIDGIQQQAYADHLLENIDVLKSKWLASPSTCFIHTNDQNGKPMGYLLAHAWPDDTPPKLHQVISHHPVTTGLLQENVGLYLHDLALANDAKGKGVATQLVKHFLAYAEHNGFSRILLVAVQGSESFWSRFGFETSSNLESDCSYGDNSKIMTLKLSSCSATD